MAKKTEEAPEDPGREISLNGLYNREEAVARILATVNQGLAAAGYEKSAISEDQLSFSPYGYNHVEALLTVEIGRGLDLPIRSVPRGDGDESLEITFDRFAHDLVKALPNIERLRWRLRRYAAAMRREALSAIAAAKKAGLTIELASVKFKDITSRHLASQIGDDPNHHVVAEVIIEHLGEELIPEFSSLYIDELDDVAESVADVLMFQAERQEMLTMLLQAQQRSAATKSMFLKAR